MNGDAPTGGRAPLPPDAPVETPIRPRLRALWLAIALLAVPFWFFFGSAAASFLRQHRQILPPCLFHKLTGLHCPGCGGTRAFLALLEGDPVRAFHNNMLLACSLPFLAWWGLLRLRGRPVRCPSVWLPVFVGVVVVAYWVLRNLPAFSWLAPVDGG